MLQKALHCQENAVLELQRYLRGHLSRNRILGNLFAYAVVLCFISLSL